MAVSFVLLLIAFLVLDVLWLTAMTPTLYRPALGPLMRDEVEVLPAVAFYVIYAMGMAALAVLPSARTRHAAARGGLLGLVSYATYDLSNQATLRGWSWSVTVADLCWGIVATASACALAHWLVARMNRHEDHS